MQVLIATSPTQDSGHLVLLSQAGSSTADVQSQDSSSFLEKGSRFVFPGRFIWIVYEEGGEATGSFDANP